MYAKNVLRMLKVVSTVVIGTTSILVYEEVLLGRNYITTLTHVDENNLGDVVVGLGIPSGSIVMFPLDAILGIGTKILDKVFPDPAAAEAAKAKLLELQQNGELAKINADVAEAHELTERLKADMASDSWLSKNIRPMTLIAILSGYFIFAGLSAAGIQVNEAYVKLLGEWGMLIMSFYFGGRTLEKIIDMRGKK